MAHIVGKFGDAISRMGFRDAIAYSIDIFLTRHLRIGRLVTYGFYAQPVPGRPGERTRIDRETDYRLIGPDEPCLETLDLDQTARDFRFRHGGSLVGALRNGRIIAALWFAQGEFPEDEVRCTYRVSPAEETAWDFGVHVNPEYRMSPIFAGLWRAADGILSARGVNYSYSRISTYNPVSMASHERLGAQRIGKARFLVLFGVQIMWGNVAPYFHISLPGGRGPVLCFKGSDG